jgi:hypothetical protein
MKVRHTDILSLQDFLEVIACTMTSSTTTANKSRTPSNTNTKIPRTDTIAFVSKVVLNQNVRLIVSL